METTQSLLFSKIMVKEPYNILYDLQKETETSIIAKVDDEYCYKDEHGPISISEAGRHLAILGSMVLADKADAQNYYLAVGADLKRHKFTSKTESQTFKLFAELINVDKKKGEVYGIISNEDNEIIYEAVIQYNLLRAVLFPRLFKQYKYTDIPQNNFKNPYRDRRSFSDIKISKDEIEAVYGTIQPEECLGHFEEYPALPVAIISNLFGELGVRLFLHNFPQLSKAYFTNAKLSAQRLAFHGEHLTFKAEVVTRGNDTLSFYCEALINNIVVAKGESEIKGV